MADYKPISAYGLIGNRHSAALVGLDGSIDWCCLPRFDSPSVFAAILDAARGGRFAITPAGAYSASQRYLEHSNVLETRFRGGGVASLVDCMPFYLEGAEPVACHEIVRLVRGEEGAVDLAVEYAPRPDYARAQVELQREGRSVVWRDGERILRLDGDVEMRVVGDRARARMTVRPGDELVFVLRYQDAHHGSDGREPPPVQRVERCLRYWQAQVSEVGYQGLAQEQVVRSFLALHLLSFHPTGAIIAAPTTSLPERIGGSRNWDYRYTWLRDASFTIDALLTLGHGDDARGFLRWLGEVCARHEADLRIMYRIDGSAELEEQELPHLEGYRGSAPVRIGNGAAGQVQQDVYGEVVAAVQLMVEGGEPLPDGAWDLLCLLADRAAQRWQQPGSGIWEMRGGPYHFVYSKVMCWVALLRAAELARKMGRAGRRRRSWLRTAESIRREVLERGWSREKEAFVQRYDSQAMDASNLLLPVFGFIPYDDPRTASTVERIRQELGEGPFLWRYRPEEADDGVGGEEGAFALCSFWLVRVLARMGRVEEARELMDELLGRANHLGLFAEMIDPHSGEALGNFPQAFTHIGLILAARECGMEPPPAK